MMSPSPLRFAGLFGGLALAGCTEQSLPTQPESAEPAPSVAAAAAAGGSWTERASSPGGHGMSLGMALNAAGQSIVYAFGGHSGDHFIGLDIAAYNVSTNTWIAKTTRVFATELNGVGKIGSKLYFTGGYLEVGTAPRSTNRVFAYDYLRDRLMERAPMPKATAEGVTGVIDGKLYVLPGACDGDSWPAPTACETAPIRQLYRYDPATNTWATRRPAPNYHRAGGAAVLDGKFYVVAGFRDFTPIAKLDVYDPKTNTWRTLAPMPASGFAQATAFQNKLFVVSTTFLNGSAVSRTFMYNPVTNTWRTLTDHPRVGAVTRVSLDGTSHVFGIRFNNEGPAPSFLYMP